MMMMMMMAWASYWPLTPASSRTNTVAAMLDGCRRHITDPGSDQPGGTSRTVSSLLTLKHREARFTDRKSRGQGEGLRGPGPPADGPASIRDAPIQFPLIRSDTWADRIADIRYDLTMRATALASTETLLKRLQMNTDRNFIYFIY